MLAVQTSITQSVTATLGHGERGGELPVDRVDRVRTEFSGLLNLFDRSLGPLDLHLLNVERAADQRPLCVDEAQHGGDLDSRASRGGEGRAHQSNLLQHSIDDVRAVATTDDQPLNTCPEESAVDSAVRAPLILLGVDHHDPTRTDDKLIDVDPGAWNAPIVEHLDPCALQGVEPCP